MQDVLKGTLPSLFPVFYASSFTSDGFGNEGFSAAQTALTWVKKEENHERARYNPDGHHACWAIRGAQQHYWSFGCTWKHRERCRAPARAVGQGAWKREKPATLWDYRRNPLLGNLSSAVVTTRPEMTLGSSICQLIWSSNLFKQKIWGNLNWFVDPDGRNVSIYVELLANNGLSFCKSACRERKHAFLRAPNIGCLKLLLVY